ncbi:hypothetical protein DNTS_026092 [Danionella cerebrum]|uniref:Uncharacterized protein n=1 Tax=Danionella cerebrum TaxID=2873325 RepID=A0A553NHZ7_9TELE|nr:hypothetical protein DNTS_026092 [Danionella translucida]
MMSCLGDRVELSLAEIEHALKEADESLHELKREAVQPINSRARVTMFKPYLAQVQLAARHEAWSDGEMAIKVALALEGPALQVLLDLALEERNNIDSLEAALKYRFGQRVSSESSREETTDGGEFGGLRGGGLQLCPLGFPHLPRGGLRGVGPACVM